MIPYEKNKSLHTDVKRICQLTLQGLRATWPGCVNTRELTHIPQLKRSNKMNVQVMFMKGERIFTNQ